ncbi:hypothetical protein SUGI_0640240 [Cryptomeria japonica]|nr:hypothetical protein SUGI_0640240 [Cryptomeria japonica]
MEDTCFVHEAVQPRMSTVSECSIYSSTGGSPVAVSPWNEIQSNVYPTELMLNSQQKRPLSNSPPDDLMLDSQQNRALINYRCISSMYRHGGNILSLAAGNGLLYTGSESKNIRVWTYPVLKEYSRFKSGSGSVNAILVARDKIFSAHNDLKIRVWRRSSSKPSVHKRQATLPTLKDTLHGYMPGNKMQGRHLNVISSLAYDAAKDVLYSASWDKTVKVWRMSDLKCVETIVAHDEAVNALAIAPNGLLYSGSDDCTVKMWESGSCLGGRTRLMMIRRLHMQVSPVKALVLSADGNTLYAGLSDGGITVWEKREQVMQYSCFLRGHRHAALCLSAVGNNLLFSGSTDGTIRVWKREIKPLFSCLAVLQGQGDPVKCIATIREDAHKWLVFSGSHDGAVMVWRVRINMVAPVDDGHDYFRIYKA